MRLLILFFLLLSTVSSNDKKKIVFQFQNKQNLEWWSKYNNNGIDFKKAFLSISYQKPFKSKSLTFNAHFSENKILLGESFFSFNTKYGRLQIGKYYRNFSSYLNDDLSSGSMLLGINAPPLPKIGINGNYRLKKRNDLIFHYGSSNGFFEKNEVYKEAPYYHDKFIYLSKIGNINEFGFGFVHTAMWGGYANDYGRFPSGFDSFLKVLVSADGKKQDNQPHANALGNHLGIWDFYFILNREKTSIKFYYQHIFEDTSGIRFANKYDGLWGLEIVNSESKNIFLLEYLETTNQNIDPPYVEESYYNHWDYPYGWSFKGNVIGNPHINSLNVVPVSVVHLGSIVNINQILSSKFLLSRKINKQDDLNFLINLSRKFNDNLSAGILLFSESGNVGIGLKTSWKLK